MTARGKVKATAHESLAKGDALAWFERVYQDAQGTTGAVPWADLAPNPGLLAWIKGESWDGCGERALVVGCGLGDDAEYLSARGCHVTAFDVAPTAVAWCKKRFPTSRVDYVVADLLVAPNAWTGAFDFVFEAYTIQSLPPGSKERASAIRVLSTFLAPGGRLLVLARSADRMPAIDEGPPWPLVRAEVDAIGEIVSFDEYAEDDGVRRFRAAFRSTDPAKG
jgi:SAM-dependent methyltransferase